MSISLQTNVNSLVAQQNLNVANMFQSKTIQQLTSGYRINQAGDDAAGLAVANQFSSNISELTQGVANGNDGVAQLQIMDGGMSNISQILNRLQTLATQSASGTFTGLRTTLNTEFQNDLQEIDRQAQSIGLNSGGTFAQSLNVYLGQGSGSQSLNNGIVTLNLSASSVDSQSLGLKGMEAVNLISGSLNGTNAGTDIGASSATSVQNIVGNTTGGNANQEAVAGYAQFFISGAGFSDANKTAVSVNLANVTDTTTLAAAVNSAIKAAGTGVTAAATAFQNANITASVHTDTAGGQELAFSSSTSAFQVQAGDQMANALLGNVSNVGTVANPIAQGNAVASTAATTVTGANTSTGTGFTAGQKVSLVVTGGGLASPVTLQVNTTNAVSTSGSIADLENQFAGNAALQAAGLSMAGSTTTGTSLSFKTASGQGFNVQVTGDTAGLLGLGAFSAGNTGQANYSTISAAVAYSSAAVTGAVTAAGVPTATATSAGLEISINGATSTALTPIDLTSGPSAAAATITTGIINPLDITALNDTLNIVVTNNGVSTAATPITISTNQAATAAAVAGTMVQSTYAPVVVSAANLNNQFTVSLDGGAAKTVTIADSTAGGYADSGAYLTAVQGGLDAKFGAGVVQASWAIVAGNPTGALTLTDNSATTGTASTVAIGAATTATAGTVASTLAGMAQATFAGFTTSANNDSFMATMNNGVSQVVQMADKTYAAGAAGAASFLADIQGDLNTTFGAPGGIPNVAASWAGGGTGELTLTSVTAGANSAVGVSANTYASHGTLASTVAGMTQAAFAGFTTAAGSDTFMISKNGAAAFSVKLNDTTYAAGAVGAAAFLGDLTTALGANGVSATWAGGAGALTLTSATTGDISSVAVSAATDNTHAVAQSFALGVGGGSDVITSLVVSAAEHNNLFTVAVDGGGSQTVTVADGTYTSGAALASAISGLPAGVSAAFDTASGKLVLSSTGATTGAADSLNIGSAVQATPGMVSSTTVTQTTAAAAFVVAGGADSFDLALNGGTAVTVAVGDTTYNSASVFLAAVQLGLDNTLGSNAVTAGWDAATGALTLTSGTLGSNSSVVISATNLNTGNVALGLGVLSGTGSNAATNTGVANLGLTAAASATNFGGTAADTGLTKFGLNAGTSAVQGNHAAVDGGLAKVGLSAATSVIAGQAAAANSGLTHILGVGTATGLIHGLADTPTTVQSIAAQIQTALSTAALVTVNAGKITIASASKGANSAVTVSAGLANSFMGLPAATLAPVVTLGANMSTTDLVANLNAQFAASNTFQAAGLQASGTGALGVGGGNFITVSSSNGTQFRLNALGGGVATTEDLGFGIAGTTFSAAAPTSTGTSMSALAANGISNSGAFTFTAMQYGDDKQAVTLSAMDATGLLETKTITLGNNAATNQAGANIYSAAAYINQQLQASTANPALQQIMAVVQNVGAAANGTGGAQQINFVSNLSNFTVGVGGTANADGLHGGVATQISSKANGSGANMSINTQTNAEAAVTAVTNAVSKLGSAQAAVGIGENQLSYAISLASSQITNYSAAESAIRDANVAQQAANLTKAQVLQQANIAAMAQANSAPQAVLKLLQG